MKIASAIEGGLAGATTLSLLSNTLKKINGSSSHVNLWDGNNLRKRLKKAGRKKPGKSGRQIIELAGDLLGSTAYLGLAPLGRKKHALLRGALLGTAAGLGAVFLDKDHEEEGRQEKLITRLLEVSLYTIGGMIAGKAIEGGKKKKRKK